MYVVCTKQNIPRKRLKTVRNQANIDLPYNAHTIGIIHIHTFNSVSYPKNKGVVIVIVRYLSKHSCVCRVFEPWFASELCKYIMFMIKSEMVT